MQYIFQIATDHTDIKNKKILWSVLVWNNFVDLHQLKFMGDEELNYIDKCPPL